jgi:hypothetical protein
LHDNSTDFHITIRMKIPFNDRIFHDEVYYIDNTDVDAVFFCYNMKCVMRREEDDYVVIRFDVGKKSTTLQWRRDTSDADTKRYQKKYEILLFCANLKRTI